MTTNFRKGLAPTKARLLGYLTTDPTLPSTLPADPDQQIVTYKAVKRELTENIACIDSAIDLLDAKHDEWLRIIENVPAEDKQKEEEVYDAMLKDKDGLLNLIERARDIVVRRRSALSDIDSAMLRLGASTGSRAATPDVKAHLELPKMKPLVFSGDSRDWPLFWGYFDVAVHSKSYPKIEKLAMLVSLLKKDAKKAIAGYSIKDECYDLVVETLKEKYGQDENLCVSLYRDLQRLPPVSRTHDFCSVVNDVEIVLRQLEALGEDLEHPQVRLAIEDKMPLYIKERIYEAKDQAPVWNVGCLRKTLRDIARRKEKVNASGKEQVQTSMKDLNYFERHRNEDKDLSVKPRVSTVFSSFNNDSATEVRSAKADSLTVSPSVKCFLCKGEHVARNCDKYSTPQQKVKRAEQLRLCSRCLLRGHNFTKCMATWIICHHCKGPHFAALCLKSKPLKSIKRLTRSADHESTLDKTGTTEESASLVGLVAASQIQTINEEVFMMCKEVSICNVNKPELKEDVLVFFDPGSHKSFIEEGLATRLELEMTPSRSILVSSFGSKTPKRMNTKNVLVGLETEKQQLKILTLSTIDFLTRNLEVVNLKNIGLDTLRTHSALLGEKVSKRPSVLIGIDHFFEFFVSVHELSSGFNVVQTILGPLIAGKGYLEDQELTEKEFSQNLALDIDELWRLDSIGIDDSTRENEDDLALEKFKQSLKRDDQGRFCVGWPWKEERPNLARNFGLCVGRLRSVVNQYRDCSQILAQYDNIFKEQLAKGMIELAPREPQSALLHYLPHHAVITPNKNTTKTRIVFDASAKSGGGKSLNECLFRGPVYLPDLVGVLFRWRKNKVVLIGDIEKAFLQVGLHEEEREVTRFLWVKDLDRPPEKDNLVTYRYCRIPFGVISSPFLLAGVIKSHLESLNSALAAEILNNLYADNIMLTTDDLEVAKSWYPQVKEIFRDIAMNIREFLCNRKEVQETIPETDRMVSDFASVLGVKWDIRNDTIIMKTLNWCDDKFTKRKMARFFHRHFDPVGFLVPCLLRIKKFSQLLWKENLKWDERFSANLVTLWQQIMENWEGLSFVIPRLAPISALREIHLFVDGSKDAYCAVIYGKFLLNDSIQTRLLFAKSRVAPLKPTTIPRIELLGALIGVRALKFYLNQSSCGNVKRFLWSDSKTVILWTRNENYENLPRFVSNRVREIRQFGQCYRYVPTACNPADCGTRGFTPAELLSCNLWWEGPQWMKSEEKLWPQSEIKEEPFEKLVEWSKLAKKKVVTACHLVNKVSDLGGELVDVNRFEKWSVLVRTVQKIVLFLKKTDKIGKVQLFSKFRAKFDDFDAYKIAENLLLKQAQIEITSADIEKWTLVKDENGVFRMFGRLGNCEIGVHPIFLPRKCPVVKLLILQAHKSTLHSGISHTWCEFKQKFYIEQGRNTVRKTLKNDCLWCRRFTAKPFSYPIMPPLPVERVKIAKPFQHAGLDYAGPFQVKDSEQKTVKIWVILFTCLVTRAAHLECVRSQSTFDFVQAFNRFSARRGCPESIVSDNASQIVIGKTMLNVKWNFITVHAPWKGGIYERIIGIMKSAMKRALKGRLINVSEFENLVIQVEKVLNSRPITQAADDTFEVLRPADFLMPHANLIGEENDTSEALESVASKSTAKELRKRFRETESCLEKFWDTWKREYLNCLRDRAKREHAQNRSVNHSEPKLGEIVLLHDEDTHRGLWRLAKIVELIEGTGGKVRSAKILLPNKLVIERPINLLYSLELSQEDAETNNN